MNGLFESSAVSVAALTFAAVLCVGGAVIAMGSVKREAIESRLEGKGRSRRLKAERASFFTRILGSLGKFTSPKGLSQELLTNMTRAGFHGANSASVFVGTKLILFISALVGFGFLATLLEFDITVKLFAVLGASAFIFFVPNMYLSMRCARRSTEIRGHLPDAIDLLEICVSGGMGLDQAWNAVSEEIRQVCPILADEMALTNLEKHLGADRGTAMRHMAERTGAEELSSLVAVLVQSERFGTSVAEALKVFTTSMREIRSQRAEENAEQMAVKMLFPMVTMIFPVVLIIAVGPAGITLTQILGN